MISTKQMVFCMEYVRDFNATRAAIRAGYSEHAARAQGSRLLTKADIRAEVQALIDARTIGYDEMLIGLSEQGRASLGDFFKITEEWTPSPLPTQEVLDTEERLIDEETGDTRTYYLVRRVVLDVEKMVNPQYAHLVKKFGDSPKNGLLIELYDRQSAWRDIARLRGLDKQEPAADGSEISFALPAYAIAPSFITVYRDLMQQKHSEYVFRGGRGSTKSSFVSLAIIEQLINNPQWHGLVTRQVKDTLRDSVYAQLVWAINYLGLAEKFRCTTSPLEITYIATGQKIYFRGADDPLKIKSIKPQFGHIGLLWFEELDQYHGPEAIRSIVQSAIRGGDMAYIFKSLNPPRSRNNWTFKELSIPKPNRYVHDSNYTTVPQEWLGKTFLDEAEFLKEVNPDAFLHEYMGEAISSGGLVFENVQIRKITEEEIKEFDHVLHGLDFGYFPDPAHYARMHYDSARLTLYIFGEVRKWKTGNRALYDHLVEYGLLSSYLVTCDSAEPKSIADLRDYGMSVRAAEKGPESVRYSMKWLQSLKAIVIDNERAPAAAEEFLSYEHEMDKDGNYLSDYPDVNNHGIDAVRYGTNKIWKRRGQ
ncbi:MAG: PBSX family phage terminase large subunit [Bellilinea sp.]